MADTELDAFLGAKNEPVPEAQPEPTPEPVEQEQAPEEAPEQEEAPPAPEPKPGERTVPLAALEAERAQRRDHKERAARLEGELAELRRQFDEAKRAAQQPQQPQAPPPQQYIPNPAQDPQGFVQWQQEQMALSAIDARLNMSEMHARKEFGAEIVDAAAADFKAAMQANPSLQQELFKQPHPYEWVVKRAETMKLQREIGDDPAAYRAKLRAELEAELAARGDAPLPPPVSPAAGRAPSLANARSAAPRATGAWAGPTPMDEILRR